MLGGHVTRIREVKGAYRTLIVIYKKKICHSKDLFLDERIILKMILKGSGWECVKQTHFADNVRLSRDFINSLMGIQYSTQTKEFIDCVSEASCRFVKR